MIKIIISVENESMAEIVKTHIEEIKSTFGNVLTVKEVNTDNISKDLDKEYFELEKLHDLTE